MNIHTLTHDEFKKLPLVIEGESKEVRYAGHGQVVIRLKPTIYSYTHNRTGTIEGSDTVRLQVIQKILPHIQAAGIDHSYIEVNDRWILSRLVLQPKDHAGKHPFVPHDMSKEEVHTLPVAPPIEVIAKIRHTGTSKHRYYNLAHYPTRSGVYINHDEHYPHPLVRFDWRNPMYHPGTQERLADEVLAEPMADWYIDTKQATKTAHKASKTLQALFHAHHLELWDICFFISEDGHTMFGEISPDCMRVRTTHNESVDKDVWRAGGSSEYVLEKWQRMRDMLNTIE